MSKQINYVGHSRVAGQLKFRTAADQKRVFQLEKLGDTDIRMTRLPSAMSKSEAAKWALTAEFFAKDDQEVFRLFTDNVRDENPFAKPKKPQTQKKLVTVTSRTAKIKSGLERFDWDAPMSRKQAARIRAEFMKQLKAVYEAN